MRKPYAALFTSIVAVSFAAIFIETLIDIYSTHPLSIAFYRLLFTTLLILPFVILHKKTRNELRNLPRSTLIIMVGIGVILAAHFALWITSLELTSVASSVLLVTAHPVLVGPISHYFFKERLSTINTVGIILSVTGVSILVIGNYGLGSFTLDSLEGNILAMLGGVGADEHDAAGVLPADVLLHLHGRRFLLHAALAGLLAAAGGRDGDDDDEHHDAADDRADDDGRVALAGRWNAPARAAAPHRNPPANHGVYSTVPRPKWNVLAITGPRGEASRRDGPFHAPRSR